MVRKKRLSKKKLAVIEDMSGGELDEQGVLDKYKISKAIYNKWQSDELFAAEIERRITMLRRRSKLFIARYTSLAASKLIQLTESGNEETARKACLDIISLPGVGSKKGDMGGKEGGETAATENLSNQLPTETAQRVLAALAEAENCERKDHNN